MNPSSNSPSLNQLFSGPAPTWEMMGEWALAAIALVSIFALGYIAKRLIKRAQRQRSINWLRQLGPSLANLIYIIGLQVFVELAPLNPKLTLWLNSFVYVAAVLTILSTLRRGSFLALDSYHGDLEHGFGPLL